MQICKYANKQLRKYENMQLRKYAINSTFKILKTTFC